MAELRKFTYLVSRNTKCYFKDKMMFFCSMITPLVLLVLFFTFLRNVYIDSFNAAFPAGFSVDSRIINGLAGAWLFSSVLSVCSVTVAFSANVVMVEDKSNNMINDFKVAPVKSTTISLSYLFSNIVVIAIIMLCVLALGCIYLVAVGWYISVGDFFMILLSCICNIMFGSLLSMIVMSFVKSQGVQSAVVALVSALYGFISGAYMPISSFSKGLANVLGLLPGTYSTSILRNHFMNGYLEALSKAGVPDVSIKGIKDGFDANIYVFGNGISIEAMYGILLGSCAVLLIAYVLIVVLKDKKVNLKEKCKLIQKQSKTN